jgi:hypothetical protein
MSSKKTEAATTTSKQQPAQANQFRAIGPGAIAGAVVHTPKKKPVAQKITSPRQA